jgi:NADH:ubiquinone oxidoreductase subunit 6 (subunit J)
MPDMEFVKILFYLFGTIILLSALMILFTRNVVHSAYLLILVFLSIAGIYVIAHAEFVAVTQIIIYAGGILVLIIFGIMLTNRMAGQKIYTGSGNKIMGGILGVSFFILLAISIFQVSFAPRTPELSDGSVVKFTGIQSIGIKLMTEYVLLFELAGILILIALVGAAFMARKDFGKISDDTH